jgi:hypothetical protein
MCPTDVNKCMWTVAQRAVPVPAVDPSKPFEDLSRTIAELMPSAIGAYVTVQAPDEFSRSHVHTNGTGCAVDAVIEIETDDESPPLDALLDYLGSRWTHVQGWRVSPTLIYDSTRPRAMVEPSRSPAQIVFIERLDGTTKGHFDRNWYIHAGHSDGLEHETEASLAERRREEEQSPDRLYRQNRVIEPITPTDWRIDGYAQLQLGFFVPELGDVPYPRVRGEAPFDRWPPRILQGYEYRIL